MKTKIYDSYHEFDKRDDRSLNGVSKEFAEVNSNWESDNSTNTGCWNCWNCRDCRDCRDCSSCRDFQTNPERITSPIIGSRDSQTTYYWTDETEQIICGCFKGTMEEFEDAIKETHGDNEHGKSYMNWIKRVKNYIA